MTRPQGSIHRGIVLLRRSNGSRVLDAPREMPGYSSRGPSTALCIALERLGNAGGERGRRLHEMALEQIEREQGCESEAAE